MVIKEFLPNPVGPDTAGEYLALYNESEVAVDLSGWKVKNSKGKSFSLDGYSVPPGETLTLPYAVTGMNLNNAGEALYLFGASGEPVDSIRHAGKAQEGRVYGRESEDGQAAQALFEDLPPARSIGTEPVFITPALVVFALASACILAGVALWVTHRVGGGRGSTPAASPR